MFLFKMYFQLCRKQKNKSTHVLLRRKKFHKFYHLITWVNTSKLIRMMTKKDFHIHHFGINFSTWQSELGCSVWFFWWLLVALSIFSDIHGEHQELSHMKRNMNRRSKHQTTEFTSTVVAYLHYIHSHTSPLACIHGFKNPCEKNVSVGTDRSSTLHPVV